MSIFSSIGSGIVKFLDANTAVFSHPIVSLTKGISAAEQLNKRETGNQKAVNIVGTTAVAAAGIVGGAAAISSGAVGTLLKSVGSKVVSSALAHPIQTTAAALVGVPFVVGAIKSNPSLVTSLPSNSFSAGAGLAKTIEEHPVASGIIGSVAGGALLYEGYKALTGGDTTINNNGLASEIPASNGAVTNLPSTTGTGTIPTNQEKPITPETQTISVGKRKKARHKTTVKQQSAIINRVSVLINNRNINKQVRIPELYVR